MMSDNKIKPTQRRQGYVVAISLRPIAILIFLGLFAVPSTFAQADYSTIWVDDSNPDAGYIVGAGVTDNDYTADEIGVEATLTSPSGRTITNSADDVGSVRVEVTLPWDWEDIGTYFIQTRHQPLCWGNWDGSMIYETRRGGGVQLWWNPDYYRCMESRITSAAFPIGISYLKMRKISTTPSPRGLIYTYERVEPCDVTCRNMLRHTTDIDRGECMGFAIPYGPLGCLIFTKIISNTTCVCYDTNNN